MAESSLNGLFTIEDFIKRAGVERIALSLGVDDTTVYKWKNWQTTPEPHNARKLILLSYNELSWEGIYTPYFKRHTKKWGDERQLKFSFWD